MCVRDRGFCSWLGRRSRALNLVSFRTAICRSLAFGGIFFLVTQAIVTVPFFIASCGEFKSCAKKETPKKVISFAHFESMTSEKNGILGNVKNNCAFSLRLLAHNNAMDAIDLAICLSLTYLLSTCKHRCALHVGPCDFIQVLDAPWLRCGGSWKGSGGQCGSCHYFLTVTLLQLM